MQKLNFDKQTIIFSAIVIFLAVELVILLPWAIKRMASLNKGTVKLQRQLKAIERDWPNKDRYLNNQEQLKKEIKALRDKFIFSQEETRLLAFISAASKSFGLEIQTLSPKALQDYASTNFGEFKYLPLTVKAKGKYQSLLAFLKHLKASQYFFDIKKINIQSGYQYNSVEMAICGIVELK